MFGLISGIFLALVFERKNAMTVKNMSIIALVCGIVGIVGPFIPGVKYISFICGVAGIVLGALALKKVKASGETESKGFAVAGLVTGIVGTAVSVIGMICIICTMVVGAAALGGMMETSEGQSMIEDIINMAQSM